MDLKLDELKEESKRMSQRQRLARSEAFWPIANCGLAIIAIGSSLAITVCGELARNFQEETCSFLPNWAQCKVRTNERPAQLQSEANPNCER